MEIRSTDGSVLIETDGTQEDDAEGRKTLLEIDLDDCDLPKADLVGVVFRASNLVDCNFSAAQFKNATFEGVSVFGTCFENSDLRNSQFYLVLAFGASFRKASLVNAKFFGGNFEDVDFSEADLSQALFGRDNLGGATVLYGANFLGTTLEGVKFEGCLYDDTTIFPEFFLPEKHGLVHRDRA